MDEKEKLRIRGCLHPLVTFTICDGPFLSFFFERKILGFGDIDGIVIRSSPSLARHFTVAFTKEADKAIEFYRLIQGREGAFPILIEGLKKTDQTGVIEILETGIVPPSLEVRSRVRKLLYDGYADSKRSRMDTQFPMPQSNLNFDVDPPVRLFTGRRRELDDLHQIVLRNGGSGQPTVISQMTSISGLGGIGKTQLGRQYILEHRQDFDNNCVWLGAENESGLADGFRRLAKDTLGLTTKDANGTEKDIKSVVGEVYKFFQASKSLFVFDNAEKAPWLTQFLPVATPVPGQSRPFVIITSRNREWDKGTITVDLSEMEVPDAVLLVKRGLDLEEDTSQDEDILKLVKRLQYFPLAIQQAIAYILDQQVTDDYSVKDYLGDFEKSRENLLGFKGNELLNDYTMTTFTTWKMTVDKIGKDQGHGPIALKTLYAMAYLTPDKIKRELFFSLPDVSSEAHLKSAVRLLVSYSMVNGEDKQRLLSIHRLVQEVTRIELNQKELESPTLDSVLKMLTKEKETDSSKSLSSENMDHSLSAWSYLWNYPNLVETFSSMIHEMVRGLHDKGRYSEAVQFGSDAVSRLSHILNPDHDSVLATETAIAYSLQRMGRIKEVMTLNEKTYERRKSLFGEDDPRTLSAQIAVARALQSVGKNQEAAHIFLSIYDKRRDQLGPDHLDTLEAHHLLAVALQRVCDFQEALKTHNQVLDKYVNQLGENHITVLKVRQNLAVLYEKMGKFPEALDIFRDVHTKLQAIPIQDQDVTLTMHVGSNLGELLDKNGKYEEALLILEENYLSREKVLGEDHPGTLRVLGLIGTVLRHLGRPEQALDKHRKVYQKYVSIFEDVTYRILMASRDIAEDLSWMGKHEESIYLFEEGIEKLEKLLGEEHHEVVSGRILLGYAIERQGKDWGKARQVLEQVRETVVTKSGEDNQEVKEISERLQNIQLKLNDQSNNDN